MVSRLTLKSFGRGVLSPLLRATCIERILFRRKFGLSGLLCGTSGWRCFRFGENQLEIFQVFLKSIALQERRVDRKLSEKYLITTRHTVGFLVDWTATAPVFV